MEVSFKSEMIKSRIMFIILLILSLASIGCSSLFNNNTTTTIYTIAGQVIDKDGEGVPGVEIFLNGERTMTVTTDDKGYYIAEVKGRVTVEAMKEGYIFDPSHLITTKEGSEYNFQALAKAKYKKEILIEVIELDFGQLQIHQFKIHDHENHLGATKAVLLTSSREEGFVQSVNENLYGVNLKGEVLLALLDENNRLLGEALIPTGTYKKTFLFNTPREEIQVKDLCTRFSYLKEQSLIGAYLARGSLSFDHGREEEKIEEQMLLSRAGFGETDLDERYFVINEIAVEFDFAFEDPSWFSILFTEKFAEVNYDFDELALYIHINNTLTNAKTGEELVGEAKKQVEYSVTKIYNETHRVGRRRAMAQVTYEFQRNVNNVTVFTINVQEVTGLSRATGFTVLTPEESIQSFGSSISRSTNQDNVYFYILGEESPDFAGGIGTRDYPYLIANADQLNAMRYYMDSETFFQLVTDIDMKEYGSSLDFYVLQNREEWRPIGSYYNPFKGHFDGRGYVIKNLEIGDPESAYVGLFGFVGRGATLQRVILENVRVIGQLHVGSLVGWNEGSILQCEAQSGEVLGLQHVGGLSGVNYGTGNIEESLAIVDVIGEKSSVGGLVGANSFDAKILYSRAEGSVQGHTNVGGLSGSNDSFGEIRGSLATGSVTGTGDSIGGLVGLNSGSDIEASQATGAVYGDGIYVGGLVGLNEESGRIDISSALGEVVGAKNTVGGLVGMNRVGVIEESYATGSVRGVTNVGGFVGVNWEEGTIKESYATGSVSGSGSRVGGFVGRNDYKITDSWYGGGVVSGAEHVGLFIGVNWDNGRISGSYASGEGVAVFIGDNRNQREEDVILPFVIDEYFGADSAVVTKNEGTKNDRETYILLGAAPRDEVDLYIAPAGTSIVDLRNHANEDHITYLQGDGKTIRVAAPKDTRDDYKVILVDKNDNKMESHATLRAQNVDDVLFYDHEEGDIDQEYRSARFGHTFVLDLGPIEGVTAWIAPAGITNIYRLDDTRDTMTKLVGSRRMSKSIKTPLQLGTEYKVYLVDVYDNMVVSDQFVVIGSIGNEDLGRYYVTLEHALTDLDFESEHTIKLFDSYTLGQEDGTDFEEEGSNPLVENVEESSFVFEKTVTIDLNRKTLSFGGHSFNLDANAIVIRNGKVGDRATIEGSGQGVMFVDMVFEDRVSIDVTGDVSFERASFKENVTVENTTTGEVAFIDIALGRRVTLDGSDRGVSTVRGDLPFDTQDVTFKKVTFIGDMEVLGQRVIFEDIGLDPNLKILGNDNLTIKGNTSSLGNDVELYDVIFDLGDGVTIDGHRVYVLRGTFVNVGTLTINGNDFFAERAVFKDYVTIEGGGEGAFFYQALFEKGKEINLDAEVQEIHFNTTFYGDITITRGTAIYSGVKLKRSLTIKVEKPGRLLFGGNVDLENHLVTINGPGRLNGRGNRIVGRRDAEVVFGGEIIIEDVVIDVLMQIGSGGINLNMDWTLTSDVILEGFLKIWDGVTLDLNGYTIFDTPSNQISIIGAAKVKNGTLVAANNTIEVTGDALIEGVTLGDKTVLLVKSGGDNVILKDIQLDDAEIRMDNSGKVLTFQGRISNTEKTDIVLTAGTINTVNATFDEPLANSTAGLTGTPTLTQASVDEAIVIGTLNTLTDDFLDNVTSVKMIGATVGDVGLASNYTLSSTNVNIVQGKITKAEDYTLLIEARNYKEIRKEGLTVVPGDKDKLFILQHPRSPSATPTSVVADQGKLSTQPIVWILDRYDNKITDPEEIKVKVHGNSWTLRGTTTDSAISGEFKFLDLVTRSDDGSKINNATLRFEVDELPIVVSNEFDIPDSSLKIVKLHDLEAYLEANFVTEFEDGRYKDGVQGAGFPSSITDIWNSTGSSIFANKEVVLGGGGTVRFTYSENGGISKIALLISNATSASSAVDSIFVSSDHPENTIEQNITIEHANTAKDSLTIQYFWHPTPGAVNVRFIES